MKYRSISVSCSNSYVEIEGQDADCLVMSNNLISLIHSENIMNNITSCL